MRLRKALWASVCAFAVFMLLWFLRLFNVLGSEYDILIRWVSTISLILCGVFIGVLISEKKIRVRGMLVALLLVTVGFIFTPFVAGLSATLASTFPFTMKIKQIIVGVLTVGYLGGYLGFLFWLKKKGVLKFGKIDWTEESA